MGGQKDRLPSVRAGTAGGNGVRTWAGNSSPSLVISCRRPGEEEQRLGLGRASRTAPGSRNSVCPTAAAHGAGGQGLRARRSLGQLSEQPTFLSSRPFWGLEHAASGPQGTDPQACERPLSLPPSPFFFPSEAFSKEADQISNFVGSSRNTFLHVNVWWPQAEFASCCCELLCTQHVSASLTNGAILFYCTGKTQ